MKNPLEDPAVLQQVVHTDLYRYIYLLVRTEPEYVDILIRRNNGVEVDAQTQISGDRGKG